MRKEQLWSKTSAPAWKKALGSMWNLRIPLILLLAVLCTASWFIASRNAGTTASAVVSLNYQEGSSKLNPNGTRFDVSSFKSTAVAERAIELAELTGKVQPQELCDALSVSVPGNAKRSNYASQDFHISTSYLLSLSFPQGKKYGISGDAMLSFVCAAYKELFSNNFTDRYELLCIDDMPSQNLEYLTLADYYQLKAKQLLRYLDQRAARQAQLPVTGHADSYDTLRDQVERYLQYTVDPYRVFISENGIARDTDAQLATLSYRKSISMLQYNKQMGQHVQYRSGLPMYNQNMISVSMIPTTDHEGDGYYMSKTKTGMDHMAAISERALQRAHDTYSNIQELEHQTQSIINGRNISSATLEKASSLIIAMDHDLNDLIGRFITLDSSITSSQQKNLVSYLPNPQSGVLKKAVKLGCAACAAALIIVYLYLLLNIVTFGRATKQVTVRKGWNRK